MTPDTNAVTDEGNAPREQDNSLTKDWKGEFKPFNIFWGKLVEQDCSRFAYLLGQIDDILNNDHPDGNGEYFDDSFKSEKDRIVAVLKLMHEISPKMNGYIGCDGFGHPQGCGNDWSYIVANKQGLKPFDFSMDMAADSHKYCKINAWSDAGMKYLNEHSEFRQIHGVWNCDEIVRQVEKDSGLKFYDEKEQEQPATEMKGH